MRERTRAGMILVPQRPREDMLGSLWFRSRQRWEPRAGILTAGDNAYEHLFICGEAACERSGENDGTETVPDTQLGPLAFRRAGAQSGTPQLRSAHHRGGRPLGAAGLCGVGAYKVS